MKTTSTIRKFNDYTHLFDINPDLLRFKQNVVIHPVFDECEETILSKIAHPGSFNIVPVVGPSGAGKTQLLNEVANQLLHVGPPSELDSQQVDQTKKAPYLPAIFVVAKNGRTFESRYKNLLLEILKQANEVLVDIGKTIPPGKAQAPRIMKSETPIVTPESMSLSGLSIARLETLVSSALKERRVRAVLIDEAQHLVPLVEQHKGYGPELRLIADGLKILGLNSRTLIVLFGTAELLSLPNLTAQFGRRSQLIHFRRYRWQDTEDREAFESAVKKFAAAWPTFLPKDLLLDHLQLLYAGCLGCVGILSDWLASAMNTADKTRAGKVTLDILNQTALRGPRLLKIHSEAEECERAFKGEEVGPQDLIEQLCAEAKAQTPERAHRNGANGKSNKQPKRKPGERLPTYDIYNPQQKVA